MAMPDNITAREMVQRTVVLARLYHRVGCELQSRKYMRLARTLRKAARKFGSYT